MARFQKLEFEQHQDAATSETLAHSPADGASWLHRADVSRRIGSYEGALRYYSRSLEEDRLRVTAWVGQVQMLVMLEEFPEAELWSRKALEQFPADGELHASRAQALGRLRRLPEAFAAVDQAMAQGGESAYRWMVRGELLLASRQSMERSCFDKAVQLDSDWLVPVEIALAYRWHGQPGNAAQRARLGAERAPGEAYPWYVLAGCQLELGLLSQSRRSLQTCLELRPDYRDAELLLQQASRSGFLWKRLRSWWNK